MSSMPLVPSNKCVVLKFKPRQEGPIQRNDVYEDIAIENRPITALKPNQVLVRVSAVSLNHRDLWIRRRKYPNIGPNSVMGSDAAGSVVAAFKDDDPLIGQRVFLTPMRGWVSHPEAPEDIAWFGTIGGVMFPAIGAFSEYVAVDRGQVVPSPPHLTDIETAAFPLAGLTAWRVVMVNGQISKGDNVLITGIGGGVATMALQLCLAQGANVFVTSGDQAKIDRAVELGAIFGDLYTTDIWIKTVKTSLTKHTGRKTLDCIITAGGGNIMTLTNTLLRPGGKVICYGMALQEDIKFSMRDVLQGKKLFGSSMGSLKDLHDATAFISEKKIVPIVSDVFTGLDKMEKAFSTLKRQSQFGKIVVTVDDEEVKSKL